MPPADVLRERLAALGISDNSRVVVYYGKDWVSPTTRVIFTLDYAGLGHATSLLDGGMEAWLREGREVTAAVPPARAGTLSPLKLQPIVVDAEYVRANLSAPGMSIVDARAAAFYDGSQTGGQKERPHRAGHIAGALSVPFAALTDDKLRLQSTEDLAAAFAKAGVKAGDTVVTYCHIGQQATATAFAARILGYKVLLYDGSFEDWSRRGDYPVEIGQHKEP
jgi:thiosulfate/3-mercaptopyruvate sulfurtransferase